MDTEPELSAPDRPGPRRPRRLTLYLILAAFVVGVGLAVSGVAVLLGLSVGIVAIFAALSWSRRRWIYLSGGAAYDDETEDGDNLRELDAVDTIDDMHDIEEADDFDDGE